MSRNRPYLTAPPIERLAQQIEELKRRVAELESRPRIVPVRDTYTPTYLGGTTAGTTTYTTQQGAYLRIGPLVIAMINLAWSAATGTGEARISVPFVIAADVAIYAGFARYSAVTWTGTAPQVVLNSGNSYLRMQGVSSDAGATITNIEAAGAAAITAVYLTS